MAEQHSWKEKIGNRIFGIPALAQIWARVAAWRTRKSLSFSTEIPFVRLHKPLSQSSVALITTGGIHLPHQPPFDMENPDGDATYREIPGAVSLSDLVITHKYYNHQSADRDPQVIFPLEHFRDLAAQNVIGKIAPRHFGLMGHIDGNQLPRLIQEVAPEVAAKLRADGVDFAFLTPA